MGERSRAGKTLRSDDPVNSRKLDEFARSWVELQEVPSSHRGLQGERGGRIGGDLTHSHRRHHVVLRDLTENCVSAEWDKRSELDRAELGMRNLERVEAKSSQHDGIDFARSDESIATVLTHDVGGPESSRALPGDLQEQRCEIRPRNTLREKRKSVGGAIGREDSTEPRVLRLFVHGPTVGRRRENKGRIVVTTPTSPSFEPAPSLRTAPTRRRSNRSVSTAPAPT